jgi:DNA ligase D-like protein (predicted 3'-phosphoesterase)
VNVSNLAGFTASTGSAAFDDLLRDYRGKRDLRSSPEPAGEIRPRRADGEPIFVVHKHLARSQHYDFRLEVDGVLKSWAVPKGPSTDPREKRLAIRVEDHPIDYAEFEGVIPEGQYGAGAVIVWDTGTYRNRTKQNGAIVPVERALGQGHVVVELHGRKLRGAYALTRTGIDQRGRERWLLVKKRDAAADAGRDILSAQPESVLSGLTVEQVASEGG